MNDPPAVWKKKTWTSPLPDDGSAAILNANRITHFAGAVHGFMRAAAAVAVVVVERKPNPPLRAAADTIVGEPVMVLNPSPALVWRYPVLKAGAEQRRERHGLLLPADPGHQVVGSRDRVDAEAHVARRADQPALRSRIGREPHAVAGLRVDAL